MDFKTVTDIRVKQWVDIPIFFFEKSAGEKGCLGKEAVAC
jgi:hypothetical protein